MLLSYFRPSGYLPQHSPKPPVYKAEKDSLDKIFIIAENWQAAHENPIEPKTEPAPFVILWPKINTTEPKPKIEPKPEPEPKREVILPKKEEPNEIKTTEAQTNPYGVYINFFLWTGLIFLGIWGSLRIFSRYIRLAAGRKIAKIPVGIRPKKHAIAGNFQQYTIDPIWLKETDRQVMKNSQKLRPVFVSSENFDGSPVLLTREGKSSVFAEGEILAGSPVVENIGFAENIIAAPLRWLDPDMKRLADFKLDLKMKDIWALFAAAAKVTLIGYFSPFIFIWMAICSFPLFLFLDLGAFRRSALSFWTMGVGIIIAAPIAIGIHALIYYITGNPDALSGKISPGFITGLQWLASLAVMLVVWWLWLQTSWGKTFKQKRLQEKIWLNDDYFGQAFGYSIGGIIVSNVLSLEEFSTAFLLGIFINILFFFISPLKKAAAEKQWTLSPQRCLNLIFIGIAGISFYRIFGLDSGFFPVIFSSLIIHFGFYLLWFPRIALLKNTAEEKKETIVKEQKKPLIQKTFENQLKSTKKVLQKELPVSKKTPVTENQHWWKVADPEKTGALILSNHGLSNQSNNLHKLLLFKNLLQLNMEDNRFDSIPEVLFSMNKLQKLNLNNNNISHLDEAFALFKNLVILELDDNQIRVLPPWLSKMPALKILSMKGNPLTHSQISRFRKEAPHISLEF